MKFDKEVLKHPAAISGIAFLVICFSLGLTLIFKIGVFELSEEQRSFREYESHQLEYKETGELVETGGLVVPRYYHNSLLLDNGKVLIYGGQYYDEDKPRAGTFEIYDPETDTSRAIGVFNELESYFGYDNYALIQLNDNELFAFGVPQPKAAAEGYIIKLDDMEAAKVLSTNYNFGIPKVFKLEDGRILILESEYYKPRDPSTNRFPWQSAILFDVSSKKHEILKNIMPEDREKHVIFSNKQQVYIAGGEVKQEDSTFQYPTSILAYDEVQKKFNLIGNLKYGRAKGRVEVLDKNTAVIMHGENRKLDPEEFFDRKESNLPEFEVFDLNAGNSKGIIHSSTHYTSTSISKAINPHTIAVVGGSKILRGIRSYNQYIVLCNINERKCVRAKKTYPILKHSAVKLQDDSLLITGGHRWNAPKTYRYFLQD